MGWFIVALGTVFLLVVGHVQTTQRSEVVKAQQSGSSYLLARQMLLLAAGINDWRYRHTLTDGTVALSELALPVAPDSRIRHVIVANGYANTGQGGYPTCSEWWSQNKTGLKSRVLDTVNTTTMTRMAAAFKGMVSKEEYTEALIRRLVSPTSLSVSQNGRTYAGYGGNADFTLDNAVNRMASVMGTSVGALGAFPAFDAMRQALPMVQALLLMAMYVLIPLVLVFGTYEYKTVVTLTFVTFGMHFLTFWWELARWLDSWLLEIMYGSDSHSRWNVAGFQNSADDLIMNFVMGTMFLVLPAVWMGALSWAGVAIGGVINEALKSGSHDSKAAGGKAGGVIERTISKS